MAKLSQPADMTLEAVDAAFEAKQNAEPARLYLGMSSIGNECSRALWYGFRWVSPINHKAATLYRFDDGHRSEDIMAERLQMVEGVELLVRDPQTGDQFACRDLGGHFRGHLDGKISGLLQAPKTQHVWEAKAVNEKKQAQLYKLCAEHGQKAALEQWDFTYYAQAVLYMHYTGLTRHYLTCASPGTRSVISVRTNANAKHAHALIDKARSIIEAKEPPAGISADPGFFKCKFCDHADVCHGDAIPQVSCRTCIHATPELDGNGRWSCARFQADISAENQRQSGECPEHRFIPALLKSCQVVDANEAENWVQYEHKDGDTFTNGGDGFSSQDIYGAGIIENLLDANLVALKKPLAGSSSETAGPPKSQPMTASDVSSAVTSYLERQKRPSAPAPTGGALLDDDIPFAPVHHLSV